MPRIITGGRIVDGDPVVHYGSDLVLNQGDAERVVRQQKAAGYDFIKIYSNLSMEGFDAIAEVARAQGFPYAGHLPAKVPMAHTLGTGMQTSEHLIGVPDATLRDGQQYVWPWSPEFGLFAERLGRSELTLDQLFDERKPGDLAALAADTGHWLVPTLVVLHGVSLAPDQMATEFQSPDFRYTDFNVKIFGVCSRPWGRPDRTPSTPDSTLCLTTTSARSKPSMMPESAYWPAPMRSTLSSKSPSVWFRNWNSSSRQA